MRLKKVLEIIWPNKTLSQVCSGQFGWNPESGEPQVFGTDRQRGNWEEVWELLHLEVQQHPHTRVNSDWDGEEYYPQDCEKPGCKRRETLKTKILNVHYYTFLIMSSLECSMIRIYWVSDRHCRWSTAWCWIVLQLNVMYILLNCIVFATYKWEQVFTYPWNHDIITFVDTDYILC